MASQIYAFNPTIPAGTPINAPVRVNLQLPECTVEAIEWRIPPGPNGLMGWAIGAAQQPVIPYNPGAWIIGNDDSERWVLDNQITSGAWQFFGYNLGIFDHQVFLRFLIAAIGIPGTSSPAAPLEAAVLTQPADDTGVDIPADSGELGAVDTGLFDPAALGPADQVPTGDDGRLGGLA
jgi:hypothetical protein